MNMTVGDADILKSAKGPILVFVPAHVADCVWKVGERQGMAFTLEKHHSASSSGGLLGLGKPLERLKDSPLPR